MTTDNQNTRVQDEIRDIVGVGATAGEVFAVVEVNFEAFSTLRDIPLVTLRWVLRLLKDAFFCESTSEDERASILWDCLVDVQAVGYECANARLSLLEDEGDVSTNKLRDLAGNRYANMQSQDVWEAFVNQSPLEFMQGERYDAAYLNVAEYVATISNDYLLGVTIGKSLTVSEIATIEGALVTYIRDALSPAPDGSCCQK